MASLLPIGVLCSGRGSNLAALLEAERAGRLGATIRIVLANEPGAKALDRARGAGVRAVAIDHRGFADRAGFEQALVAELDQTGVEWVVLAGFMRLLTRTFLDAFGGRVINIHPSLLPAFPGTHAQADALAHGVRISGCTVHLVDAGTDSGPILAQSAVRVLDDDTVESLSARILVEEHRLLPAVVAAIAAGRLRRVGRSARIGGLVADPADSLPSPVCASYPEPR